MIARSISTVLCAKEGFRISELEEEKGKRGMRWGVLPDEINLEFGNVGVAEIIVEAESMDQVY